MCICKFFLGVKTVIAVLSAFFMNNTEPKMYAAFINKLRIQTNILFLPAVLNQRENARQQTVVAAAEARLAQSVLFTNTVSSDVTITGTITIAGVGANLIEYDSMCNPYFKFYKLFATMGNIGPKFALFKEIAWSNRFSTSPNLLVQILSTGHLSGARLVFPGTDLERGVTHLEYLKHVSSAQPRLDLSKRLLQDIHAIEEALTRTSCLFFYRISLLHLPESIFYANFPVFYPP